MYVSFLFLKSTIKIVSFIFVNSSFEPMSILYVFSYCRGYYHSRRLFSVSTKPLHVKLGWDDLPSNHIYSCKLFILYH